MKNYTERELIEAACKKKSGAYEELYQRYYWLVYSQALKETCCEADAHEICQDVFLQVYRSIQDLREPAYFKTWLFRITHAKCVDLFRKSRIQYFEDSDIASMSTDVEMREEFNPVKHIRKENDLRILESMLKELPEKHKDVIELMYFQQLSLQEIADLKGVSINTIKTRVFHARKELKAKIQSYERTQGIQLSFHAHTAAPFVFSFSFWNWMQKHSTVLIHTMQVCTITGLIYVGATQVLPDFQASLQTSMRAEPVRLNEMPKTKEAYEFQPVLLQELTCTSAIQGYQLLTTWADIDTMAFKSIEEKELYQPLVNEMKVHGGTYYQLLKDSGWIQAFEAIK